MTAAPVEDGLLAVRLTTPVTRALRFCAHAWLVGDTLVDSGFARAGAALRQALTGRRVGQVGLTHAHEDHAAKIAFLAGVRDEVRRLHERGLPLAAVGRRALGPESAFGWLWTGGDFSRAHLVRACLKEPGEGYTVPGSIAYDRGGDGPPPAEG